MPTADEKLAFATRLKKALKRSPKKVETPTELALQFNLRHPNDPVTVQAAQKWMSGQSMPTIDKIATLATWLDVSIQWLRFGIAEGRPSKVQSAQRRKQQNLVPTAEELGLLSQLRGLPEHQRALVFGIAEQFALTQEVWKNS